MKTLLFITLIVLVFILWFKAISDISRTRFISDSTNRNWFLIVFLIPIFGAILYFIMKKKHIVMTSFFEERKKDIMKSWK